MTRSLDDLAIKLMAQNANTLLGAVLPHIYIYISLTFQRDAATRIIDENIINTSRF